MDDEAIDAWTPGNDTQGTLLKEYMLNYMDRVMSQCNSIELTDALAVMKTIIADSSVTASSACWVAL